jgi:hypothetical protein
MTRDKQLLEACRRGQLKLVKAALAGGHVAAEVREKALRVSAEFGQSACFRAVLDVHSRPEDETLLHAMKWGLRYDDQELMSCVMEADSGRWVITRAQLEEYRKAEMGRLHPDRAKLYLADRLLVEQVSSSRASS